MQMPTTFKHTTLLPTTFVKNPYIYVRNATEMKRGVSEPGPGVVIRILELPNSNTFLAETGAANINTRSCSGHSIRDAGA